MDHRRSLTTDGFDFAVVDHLTGGRIGVFDVGCPRCGPMRQSAKNRVRPVLRIWRSEAHFASYVCARCGLSGWTADRRRARSSRCPAPLSPAKAGAQVGERTAAARALWHEAVPLAGTPALRYLGERRDLDIDGLDFTHALRWHGGISAMVALMTDAKTGEATGIHRTFLDRDGNKGERKMLGRQGVIRLSPDEDVTLGLGITEGIEDGLAALLTGWRPVWCATSAGGIARFPVLPQIEHLTILADADEVGMRAADQAATRWHNAGREVFIASPDTTP